MTLYGDQFRTSPTSVIGCPFEEYFDQQIRELEKTAGDEGYTKTRSTTVTEHPVPLKAGNKEPEPPPINEQPRCMLLHLALLVFKLTMMWYQQPLAARLAVRQKIDLL